MTRSSWGLDTDRDLNWRLFAACGPDNAEWFFVTRIGGQLSLKNRLALDICRRCPVTTECLADALTVRVVEQSRIAGGQVIGGRPSKARGADRERPVATREGMSRLHTARHDRRWRK